MAKTFDELILMTKEELEQYLKEESEKIIESADESQRAKLRGLQWKCDMLRQDKLSPTGTMVQLQAMMWASLGELQDALHGNLKSEKKDATIINIPRNEGDEDV